MNLKKKIYKKYKKYRENIFYILNFIYQGKINPNEKIFIISLNKTGTTALAHHLIEMGYKLAAQPLYEKLSLQNNHVEIIINELKKDKNNVFQDVPFFSSDLVAEILKQFPHSKFIYISRDVEKWSKSFIKYYIKFHRERPNYRLPMWITMFLKKFYLIDDVNNIDEIKLKLLFQNHRDEIVTLMNNNENFIELDLSDSLTLNILYKKLNRKHVLHRVRARNVNN